MARINYDDVAADYERSRALPLDAMADWRRAVARQLVDVPTARILDLGSGTGVFADAFARWFDARVVAIEPSAAMRAESLRLRPHARVAYAGGTATHIPVRDSTCDAAWLSTVIHHIPDLARCAVELRRVVRGGGPVLIRSAFPGRHDFITLFRYFPAAGRVAETFPTIDTTVAAFTAAGFAFQSIESVPQISAPSLRAFASGVRTRGRADSTLAPLSEEELSEGLRALDADAACDGGNAPVVDRLDLLVLR
jgi:ubiquinone/menaquinone biosynthesis C-methylase UbiE